MLQIRFQEVRSTLESVFKFLMQLQQDGILIADNKNDIKISFTFKPFEFSDGSMAVLSSFKIENSLNFPKKYEYEEFIANNGFWYTKQETYIGLTSEFIKYHFILGIDEFYSYRDFKDSTSDVFCVGHNTKENIWYGITHRVIGIFKVGETIEVNDDSLLLSHGYISGCDGYEKEEENIQKVRDLMDNDNKIHIKDNEIAKFLAYRIVEATN